MGTAVDIEVAEELEAQADEWLRGWADPAGWPRVEKGSPRIAVDCAVCGKTHRPGTDDDPGCQD
jgi:hypothetical protein